MAAARVLLLCVCAATRLRAQCPDGTPPPCRSAAAARASRNSIAVLPFENRSSDTSLTLLAEGMADEIATQLGRIERLEVKSPSSVRFVVGRGAREPRRIGQGLGARWLVDGQMVNGVGGVRINVQVVEAARGTMRWSNTFQRSTGDLLALIRMVTDSVATAIVGTLAPSERSGSLARPTTSNAAYDLYVRGRASLRTGNGQNLYVARAMFEEAGRLDTTFVDAAAAAASTWISIADNLLAPRDAYPVARGIADAVLRRDPANAEATAALAKIALWYDWDVPGAVLVARRAAALSPVSAEARLVLGLALVAHGDSDEGAIQLLRAIDLDSLSGRTLNNATGGLLYAGRYADLLARGERVSATTQSTWGNVMRIRGMEASGRCADGAALRQQTGADGNIYTCMRQTVPEIDSAVAEARRTRPYFRAWIFAKPYAAAGDADKAIAMLEQAFRDREAWMPFIPRDPDFRTLYNDPRFLNLVSRVSQAAGRATP